MNRAPLPGITATITDASGNPVMHALTGCGQTTMLPGHMFSRTRAPGEQDHWWVGE